MISFEYPAWFIIFCLALGVLGSWLLYRKEKTFQEARVAIVYLLRILRGLAIAVIAILLLGPLLQHQQTETEKPVVIFAQDNSMSVKAGLSPSDSIDYSAKVKQLIQSLEENYDVRTYSFGQEIKEGLSMDFTDKVTNISRFFSEIYNLYSGQNLGAMILATDGIYNQGSNPVYANFNFNAPVYAVALGDTLAQKDLVLGKIYYNQIVYLKDKFQIKADVSATNLSGQSFGWTLSQATIDASGKKTFNELKRSNGPITINEGSFQTTIETTLDAKQTGIQHYRLELSPVDGEATLVNNAQDIFIDVLDGRQKILLLAHAPHPDVHALKQAIESNKNYEVHFHLSRTFRANVSEYNLVILHQLPSVSQRITGLLKKLKEERISTLFILGNQSAIAAFNAAQGGIKIKGNRNNFNEVQSYADPAFSAFQLPDQHKADLERFPPVLSPFGQYQLAPTSKVLLHQKIGSVRSKYPLLTFNNLNNHKTGIFAGEGLWRWRLYDYLHHDNHELTNSLINKTIQYLSIKEDKRKFRVSLPKNLAGRRAGNFNENEPITMDAELYDDNYELINEPDVSLLIKNDEGKEFPFEFSKTANAYTLVAGQFPYGNYSYQAQTTYNGKVLTHSGQFTVNPLRLESLNSQANHNLLHLLSNKYEGKVVYPAEVLTLSDQIQSKEEIRPVYYHTLKTEAMINLKMIFGIILGLLSIEWFTRKWQGGY